MPEGWQKCVCPELLISFQALVVIDRCFLASKKICTKKMCDIKLERDYLGLEGNREMGEGQDRAIDGYVDGYG